MRLPRHPSLTRLGPGRLILSGLGILFVVAGALVALDVRSATPLLVVGGALAVLGLVDWTDLRASHGDWQLHVTRRLEELVEREDLTPATREEIQKVTAEIEASVPLAWPAPAAASPTHRLLAGPKVVLGLYASKAMFTTFTCSVSDPDGRRAQAHVLHKYGIAGPLEIVYPDDFEEAPTKLQRGEYVVDWLSSGTAGFVAAIYGPRLIARDSFVIDGT